MSDLLGWVSPKQWIVLGLVALALVAGVVGYGELRASQAETATANRYEAAIAELKVKAADELAAETRKVLETERRLAAAVAAQEDQDAKNRSTVADLQRRLHAAAGAGQRLRDPNATGCRGGGGGAQSAAAAPADDRAADAAEAGGLLSAPLTGLLQQLTREADEINAAYISCRADAQAVRALAP